MRLVGIHKEESARKEYEEWKSQEIERLVAPVGQGRKKERDRWIDREAGRGIRESRKKTHFSWRLKRAESRADTRKRKRKRGSRRWRRRRGGKRGEEALGRWKTQEKRSGKARGSFLLSLPFFLSLLSYGQILKRRRRRWRRRRYAKLCANMKNGNSALENRRTLMQTGRE